MAGAALLGLQDEIYAGGSQGGTDPVGFVANDGVNVGWRHDAGSCSDDVGQQRLAADFMQHLGQLRFEARTLAGGQDGDRNARRSRRCLGMGRGWVSGFLHSNPLYLETEAYRRG